MTRKRAMELISHEPTRLATFKKRKASILKKARELSVLCAVPVCVIVRDGPNDSKPEIWPRESDLVSQILSRFSSLSQSEQTRMMVDKDGFLSQQAKKMQIRFQKIQREHEDLEAQLLLKNVLSGSCSVATIQDRETVTRLQKMVEMRIKEANKRIEQPNSIKVVQASPALSQLIYESTEKDYKITEQPFSTQVVEAPPDLPALIDESVEKDEILNFDVGPWLLDGELEELQLAEASDEIFNSNGVSVTLRDDVEVLQAAPDLLPLINESAQKDEILDDDLASWILPEWLLEGELEEMPPLAEVSNEIFNSNGAPGWNMVEKEIFESLDQSIKKDLIFESCSADVVSEFGSQFEKEDQNSEEIMRMFDQFGDCSSYYGSDQEDADFSPLFNYY